MNRLYYVIFIVLSVPVIYGCTETAGKENTVCESKKSDEGKPEPITDFYGIDTTDYEIIRSKIKRNEFLSEILDDYNIGYGDIERLIRNSEDIFDVRKIKAGNNYSLYIRPDAQNTLEYMIYEHDIRNHYILGFKGEPVIRKIEKPSRLELKFASGYVRTSLWDAMLDDDLDPVLASELSELYAWSIDFFGLQEGDIFKIIYEEEYIDTISNGIHRIVAACFKHVGKDFYAIPLIQDGEENYYDLEGNSLRKTFLKAPLRYSRISSRYSYSRLHPILRIRRPHHGVDYAASVGTPVYAVGDGRIIMREYQNGSGSIIKIRHNSVYTTAYMHLRGFAEGISVGKYVKQGDVIGYVGSSGLSTGPHLDFRFYKNGYAVDPLKVEAPPVEPVSENNIERFEKISKVMVQLLESS